MKGAVSPVFGRSLAVQQFVCSNALEKLV